MAIVSGYNFDVAIIGAGPAGIMAAIQAVKAGQKVVLIEKNSSPGKKLLLTGNGRCNLTNAEFNLRELVKNYNNGEFLFHAFYVFGPKETINFFEKLGVKTKTAKGKRVFPKSDDAEDVLEALEKCLAKNKAEILFNSKVIDIKKTGKKITKLVLEDREVAAKKYILCTGGKSYPLTGSDGWGYKIAQKLGHTIVEPKPALCPLKLKEEWAKNLQGIGLQDVKFFREEGEILFTHFGLSGPAVLNISGKVYPGTKISIDLFPKLNQQEVLKNFENISRKYPKQTVKNILSEFLPARLALVLLDVAKIDKNKIANNMSKTERVTLVKILKHFKLTIENVFGFDQAMVTRGGVSLEKIDHKTMKSKIIDNLFFAGEIIDVDGKTGGFNLQLCWSTGYLAGTN